MSAIALAVVVVVQSRYHLWRSSLRRCMTALRPEWIVEDPIDRLHMLCCTTAVARPGSSP